MSVERLSKLGAGEERRVLVTGMDGFTGTYLARNLEAQGYLVHGTVLSGTGGARIWPVDLLEEQALREVVREVRPHHVLHLAAISSTTHADVAQIYLVNVVGTRNLLAALVDEGATELRSLLLVSSGNIYGNNPVEPLTELLPPMPNNDYAVSKYAMELMASLWADRLPIAIVRPFNYTGKGQSVGFLIPKIVAAFRRRDAEIELGNTHVERDFSDVRDVADCYERLVANNWRGVVNVCSGRAISLLEILAICEEITGHHIVVKTNARLVRANEIHRLRGGREKLSSLGIPEFRPLRQTLSWMLK